MNKSIGFIISAIILLLTLNPAIADISDKELPEQRPKTDTPSSDTSIIIIEEDVLLNTEQINYTTKSDFNPATISVEAKEQDEKEIPYVIEFEISALPNENTVAFYKEF